MGREDNYASVILKKREREREGEGGRKEKKKQKTGAKYFLFCQEPGGACRGCGLPRALLSSS